MVMAEERKNPELHELYRVSREIHKNEMLAIHMDHERERFVRDAEHAKDEQWTRDLLQAAEDHGKLSVAHREQAQLLTEKRAKLIEDIVKARKENSQP
jgi:hypothetical protein